MRRRAFRPALILLAGLAVLGGASLAIGMQARAQTAWRITSLDIDATIQASGEVAVVERIAVDFSGEQHGIFREIHTRFEYEGDSELCTSRECYRRYFVQLTGAEQDGEPVQVEVSNEGALTRFRLGDPDVTITGEHEYVIAYTIVGALDSLGEFDQFYWNITGTWPVVINEVRVTVRFADPAPAGEDTGLMTACYEGAVGSTLSCDIDEGPDGATYTASRLYRPGEQMTVALGWPPGRVAVPAPFLEKKQTFFDYFTFDWIEFAGIGAVAAAAMAALVRLWWMYGRDREYTSLYYLTNNPEERTRPLFRGREVVVEYLPPEDWRPAQMGVILDEKADTLDVTSTIIDLAVRGYLEITEIPKKGWFGKPDWRLVRTGDDDGKLLLYERQLFVALFVDGDDVLVSDLKNTFHTHLAKVKKSLYRDALSRKWFRWNPDSTRSTWVVIGVGVVLAGAGLVVLGAIVLERALIGAPVVVAGALLIVGSRVMPGRTARGSEALRRVLGFRLYVSTAETRMQEFNEEQQIFARYLPYAIVFGCVEKWAKAFREMGSDSDDAMGWYHGTTPLRTAVLASHLSSFSNGISKAMASTPGSSGGSGFSGGGAGGGGGGGGGGAW